MKFNRVCIRAYLNGNLGDDLFVRTLCHRYPDTHFVICGKKAFKKGFDDIHNLKYVSTDSSIRRFIFRCIGFPAWLMNKILIKLNKGDKYHIYGCFDFYYRHSKTNVFISGSLFMEPYETEFIEGGYTRGERKYYASKPYVIGCNFGPYYTEGYRKFFAECFKMAEYVCLRDKYSSGLFDERYVKYAPDILFTYDKARAKKPKEDNYICISVINLIKDGNNDVVLQDAYVNAIIKLIMRFQEENQKIVLLGFCNEQGDNKVINKILHKMENTDGISYYNYPDTQADEMIGVIAYSNAVVATRYHAMIFGWLFEKKVLPLVYNIKMSNVIKDILPESECINVEEFKDKDYNLFNIYKKILDKGTIPDVNRIIKMANKHFELLDNKLN